MMKKAELVTWFNAVYHRSGCVSLREFCLAADIGSSTGYRLASGEGGFSRASIRAVKDYEKRINNEIGCYLEADLAMLLIEDSVELDKRLMELVTLADFVNGNRVKQLHRTTNEKFIEVDKRNEFTCFNNLSGIYTTILIRIVRLIKGITTLDIFKNNRGVIGEKDFYRIESGRGDFVEGILTPIFEQLEVTKEQRSIGMGLVIQICEKLGINRTTNLGRSNVLTIFERREEVKLELFKLFLVLKVI